MNDRRSFRTRRRRLDPSKSPASSSRRCNAVPVALGTSGFSPQFVVTRGRDMSRASIPRIATTLARVAVRATTTTRRFALATTTRAASSSASSSSPAQTSNRIRVVASASGDAGTRRRGASRGVVAVSRGSWSSAGRSVSTTTRAGAGAGAGVGAPDLEGGSAARSRTRRRSAASSASETSSSSSSEMSDSDVSPMYGRRIAATAGATSS